MDINTGIIDNEKFISFLKEKNITKKCPMCGCEELQACLNNVYTLSALNYKTDSNFRALLVSLDCINCGYVMLFDALVNNLVKPHIREQIVEEVQNNAKY